MNRNVAVFILLSIGFGLGAVFLAKNWIAQNQPRELSEGQVNVVSVNSALSTGSIIEAKHLTVSVLPESLVPKGAVLTIEEATGKVAKQKLYPGEILHKERVASKGEGSSLASLIRPNMRAVSIRVNDVVGVSGFILPGNKVDVLTTYSKNGKPYTEVILSNIKILAVDQKASNDENKPQIVRAVTVEVDLEQAELLMSADNRGRLQLALRNPLDNREVLVTQAKESKSEYLTDKNSVINSEPKSAPTQLAAVKTRSDRNKIEIIRGTEQETVQVSN